MARRESEVFFIVYSPMPAKVDYLFLSREGIQDLLRIQVRE